MTQHTTIIGAGLAGTLMSVFLARRGKRVTLYERLPDMRREIIPAGRSINLALAARGIHALELAGVMDEVRPLLTPMPGRMLHDTQGELTYIAYGQRPHEVIYSVSRPGLNRLLLDAAEALGVEIHFRHPVIAANFATSQMRFADEARSRTLEVPMHDVIAADGAGSVLRRSMMSELQVDCSETLLEHGYKELILPASPTGSHQIAANALHIWPRGGFMLIALPNLDGSFTVTLFHAHSGPQSFAMLTSPAAIDAFFTTHFPDAHALIPDLTQQFMAHPTGSMGTVRCARWAVDDRLLLIGDAAHAITPFHGQGMNCAFEDCVQLDRWLQRTGSRAEAFAGFEQDRRPDANAIADMALENYLEMRETVRQPKFQLQKALAFELERRYPTRFVPRYSMVMFHHRIPYAVAYARGLVQARILEEITLNATHMEQIDYELAGSMIEARLPPLT